MCGEASAIPGLRRLLSAKLTPTPVELLDDPGQAAARGAATFQNAGTTTLVRPSRHIPISLGVAASGGIVATVVEKGCAYPFVRAQKFLVPNRNQSHVTVRIMVGDR